MPVIGEQSDPSEQIASSRKPETRLFLEKAPFIVAELVQQIIECRDVRTRTRLRTGIKSIVDLICIDTVHLAEEPSQKKQISLGMLPVNEEI